MLQVVQKRNEKLNVNLGTSIRRYQSLVMKEEKKRGDIEIKVKWNVTKSRKKNE